MNPFRSAVLLSVAALMACTAENIETPEVADNSLSVELRNPTVIATSAHDVSRPLRELTPVPFADTQKVHAIQRLPRKYNTSATSLDPVVQSSVGAPLMPATGVNVEGIGQGFSGPSGAFTVQSAPPDTNGDVGPNHYVQIVNSAFVVLNKSGTPIYGPVNSKTLWSGFGGGCQNNNDGDGIVRYDRAADRWVIQQFSVTATPYLECIAVSTTPDPTGSYARYSFSYGTSFPDYPKMGLWPDGYYTTFNMFANGQTFAGSKVCAYDRAKMLAGQTATMQCFDTSTAWGGLLAADLDGTIQPPVGAPNLVVGLGTNQLAFWKFHVDWTTPANSTFTGPTTIATASFTELCNGGACIVQPGTTQKLDSLSDRLMNRVAYRAFADGHESLLISHSVTAGTSGGIRWYEVRNPTSPTIFQQGTFAPDSAYRWMPSLAMDKDGNIAVGYSVSSSTINPSIRYTGRLAGDALGTMGQGESTIIAGGGSQGTNLERWGDYASMNIDPADDCTFWFTTEYMASSGTFNWHTRVASFKFPGCGGGTGDATPPTTTLTAPAAGSTLTGTVTVSATASDNVGVTRVEFYAGASLLGTSTTAPYSISWNTTGVTNGNYSLTSRAYDAAGNVGTSAAVAVTVSNAAPPGTAVYDATLKAPKCDTVGSVCNAGTTLLQGRGTVGPEPSQPNTINSSCADGTSGTFHSDESLDALKVSTTDGTDFAPGKTVKIEATVWAYSSFSSDHLDLYYAADANAPSWTFIATVNPTAAGSQVLSATYTLPSGGGLQAVRGVFRYSGTTASSCSTGSYDDKDDIIFAVGAGTPDTTPPTTSITAPAAGATVSGTTTISANASDNVGVSKVEFYVDGTLLSTDTTSPYSASWNTTAVANGSHTLTSKAYDAAGNTGTSAAVSVTVSNTPSTELITNGGFEGSASPWVLSGNVSWSTTSPRTGTGDLAAGAVDNGSGSAYQQLTIPSTATTANLTFWVFITTSETTTVTKYDFLYVEVRNTAGTLLATLATYSNLDKNTAYAQKGAFDLSAYKGQTVRVQFRTTTDVSLPTTFRVDDVSLK